MRKSGFTKLLVVLLALVMLVGCGSGESGGTASGGGAAAPASSNATGDKASGGNVTMTDVGTPRAETLIVDMLVGRITNTSQMNPYLPGVVARSYGFRNLIWEVLWDIDTTTGKQFPVLAEKMAEPLDDTNTKFRVKLREGVKWSDGVELTTEDVVFTSEMLFNTPEIPYGAVFTSRIKSLTAIDKYTFEVETVKTEMRLEQILGCSFVDTDFKIVPKHIWENQDLSTYQNVPPIGSGPYTFEQVDPQGNWILFKKREDWDASSRSMVAGEPVPNYVMWRTYGTEEKRVMAAIQNDYDVLADLSPEAWTVLSEKNPDAKAWYTTYPYATFDDPAGRGVMYNCAIFPMNDADVRWALTLAIDINSVATTAYSGMLRASPIPMPPTGLLTKTYIDPMLPWFKDFAFSDGYKPFTDTYAEKNVEALKQQGVEGLPEGDNVKKVFGAGWWKYDTDQAEKMLLNKGFSRGANGKWLLPDGTPWQVTMAVPSGFEVVGERLAYAVIDCWQKFGIDAVAQPGDNNAYNAAVSTGTVDCSLGWPNGAVMQDLYTALRDWHTDSMAPLGENTPSGAGTGGCARWESSKLDSLINEIGTLAPDDPRVVELCTECLKEMTVAMPYACLFGTTKLVPTVDHYWTGFPTADNPYEGPWWWWSNFAYTFPKLKPTGNQ